MLLLLFAISGVLSSLIEHVPLLEEYKKLQRVDYGQIAFSYDAKDDVKEFLKLFRKLDGPNKKLCSFIQNRDEAAVKRQLQISDTKLDDQKCPNGLPVLHQAIKTWDAQIISLIIPFTDVNVRDGLGASALVYSARVGYNIGVRLLLAARANPLDVDNYGATAAHWASYWNMPLIVQAVAQADAKILKVKDQGGWLPLHVAAYYGANGVIRQLVRLNEDVSEVDSEGNVPHELARQGRRRETQELLYELFMIKKPELDKSPY